MVYVELKHSGRSEVTKKNCKTVLVNAAEKLVCLLHYLQVYGYWLNKWYIA